MRSALSLLPTLLLFWPLLISALPLPPCSDPDPSFESDDTAPCDPFPIHWAIEEGPPRLKARSTEAPADDTNAFPALKPRDDDDYIILAESENPVRRTADPIAGTTEGRIVDSRAVGANKERWIIQQDESLEAVTTPDIVDAGVESKVKRRLLVVE